ncbi:hypothetical protein EXIGLDRAFT_131607 [Exidia glandulosa HHB12029]|uniref:FHA domain-containing protein n=1 Tax=Exidia glandulosa HHB12029 TaxID=1314781 RepID=A0A165G3C0_EXIGL|nr:hypothetical protein EXIGLDRAFT_131607 [Exidia glandulosa HHB12029]
MESSTARVVTIDGLHDEILLMIFMAAMKLVDDVRHVGWETPSRLSHVCRRWRQNALAYPLLWTTLNWTPEQSLHIAHTVLQRSARALISVDLQMTVLETHSHGGSPPAEAVANMQTLVRTILRDHVGRLARLDIFIDNTFYDPDAFSPLCGDTTLSIPSLRAFSFRFGDDAIAAPDLYIAAGDLTYLFIDNFSIRSWGRLVGPRTTEILIGGFSIKLSEIVQLLQSAPNIKDLSLGSGYAFTSIEDDLSPDALDNAREASTTVGRHLESLTICDLTPFSLGLVNKVLSRDHISRISLTYGHEGGMFDQWLECLSITSLKNVTSLAITGSYPIINLSDSKANKARSCFLDTIAADDAIPAVVAVHPSMLDTLQSLSIELLNWGVFVDSLWQRGSGLMPALRTLSITISQDDVNRGDRILREVDGSILIFPSLELLTIIDRGYNTPPTLELVKHLLQTISPLVDTLEPDGNLVYRVNHDSLPAFTLPLRCQELENDDLVDDDIRRVARFVRDICISDADLREREAAMVE